MRTFVLIFVSMMVLLGSHFYRSGNVVVDDVNHIIWLDTPETIELTMSQDEARKYCEKLSYQGYYKWRLPTVKEYKSIVDKSNELNNISKAFQYNVPTGYWTDETLWRMLGYYGYYMNFTNGLVYYDNKTYKKFVRCVKDKR